MKVILVQAPARNIKFNIGGCFKVLPLGIAYIAAKLRKNKIDFDIFYPKDSKKFFRNFYNHLSQTKDSAVIVGISATLFSAREAFELARITKDINVKNIVILGGPVASFSAESIFRYSNDIDYVISGEAENAFPRLVLALKNNQSPVSIPNVSYHNHRGVISNKEEWLADMDSIGMPSRQDFPEWAHRLHPPMGRYKPAYLIETIRGCNFGCSFCSLPRNMRMRSVANVVTELEVLKKDFKAKEVYFVDPTFTINKDRTYSLCRQMLHNRIGVSWACMTRVDCVDYELLRMMKASGCYLIHFGVESANPQILQKINKGQTTENTLIAFDACNKLGIKTGAFMILASTRHDTEATANETIALIKRIRPTFVLYDNLKPIPNGPLARQAVKDSIIADKDIEEFYLGDRKKSSLTRITVFGIPKNTADNWVSKASWSFYASPHNIIKMISGVKTRNEWCNFIKGGIYYCREMVRKNGW